MSISLEELIKDSKNYKRMYSKPHYSRASVMQFASDFAKNYIENRKQLSFNDPHEYLLNVSDLLKDLGGHLQVVHLDDDFYFDGGSIYVREKTDFDVVIPAWTSPLQDKFSIAKAIGHYLIHYADGQGKRYVYRRCRSHLNLEAQWFAASLLMPKEIIESRKFYLKKNSAFYHCFFLLRNEILDYRMELYKKYKV